MTAQQSAARFLEQVRERHPRWLLCKTLDTPMPHEWTPEGWVCSCGDVVLEDQSNDTYLGSLTDAGYGSTGVF